MSDQVNETIETVDQLISRNFKIMRRDMAISQKDMSIAAGVSQSSVSGFEAGKPIPQKVRARIEEKYKVDLVNYKSSVDQSIYLGVDDIAKKLVGLVARTAIYDLLRTHPRVIKISYAKYLHADDVKEIADRVRHNIDSKNQRWEGVLERIDGGKRYQYIGK